MLLGKVKQELVRGVSEMLKVKKEDIDLESEMSEYGFDSITLTEFANKMNQEYKVELNPAVFFEHSTLGSFAEYLVSQNREQLALKYLPGASVVAEGVRQEKRRKKLHCLPCVPVLWYRLISWRIQVM